MTTLETMYAPQANSPTTSTVGNISSSATSVTVLDASALPDPPMLLVLGGDTENAETVLCTVKSSNTLTLTRAVEGTARAWAAGTAVGRLFTAMDLKAVQDNITALNTGKAESSAVPDASTSTPQMDGTASAGSASAYSRGDHRHPKDTSKQDKITVNGLLKGDGSGGVSEAIAGTDYALPSSVPTASTSTPAMDSIGSAGSGTTYARGNHVHPTDTSRQAKITASGLLKGDGSGGVSEATAGTDYQTPLTAGTDYVQPSTLSGYIPTTQKGANSGVATLDGNGKVTAAQTSARIVSPSSYPYTLQSSDAGGLITVTGTVARTVNIPSTLAVATEIEIMNYGNGVDTAGVVTVKAASGVMLNGVSQGSFEIKEQFKSAVLKAITSTAWVIQGAIE